MGLCFRTRQFIRFRLRQCPVWIALSVSLRLPSNRLLAGLYLHDVTYLTVTYVHCTNIRSDCETCTRSCGVRRRVPSRHYDKGTVCLPTEYKKKNHRAAAAAAVAWCDDPANGSGESSRVQVPRWMWSISARICLPNHSLLKTRNSLRREYIACLECSSHSQLVTHQLAWLRRRQQKEQHGNTSVSIGLLATLSIESVEILC